jgi:hypothetical protein
MDSCALQAGGQGFEPPHVHQLNLRSLNHLRCFFLCTTLVQIRDNRDNSVLFEIRKSKSVADSLRFIETWVAGSIPVTSTNFLFCLY